MSIKDLTKIQIVIILLIAGVISIAGLVGLSNYDRDYYVSAAFSNALFLAIFLLVLASPFLYYFRRKEKVEKPMSEFKPKIRIGWKRVFITLTIFLVVGTLIGVLSYLNNKPSPNIVQVASNNCPQIPIKNPQVQKVSKIFDPTIPPEGEKFYMRSTETDPWTMTHYFDVDSDGRFETIKTANTAMNHTPHVLKIITQNDNVIFEAEGAGLDIEEAKDNNGFYLIETIDWNNIAL